MIFFYLITFATLPLLSSAYYCRYNHSGITSRKTVVLELENHKYLHIYDANFEIIPSQSDNYIKTKIFLGVSIHFIDSISFDGYIMENDISTFINVTLNNSLIGYRFNVKDNQCSLSFFEADGKRDDISIEQETAILRLAESCIQSYTCGVNLYEVDRDGDLYYQSIQSTLNELIDFFIPKIMNTYITTNGVFEVPPRNITAGDFYFYQKGGNFTGLNSIQRTKDIFISNNEHVYSTEIGLRFPLLEISFKKAEAWYSILYTYGDFTIKVSGLSISAVVVVDLSLSKCLITLNEFEIVAFKHIKLDIPIWNAFSYEYTITPEDSKFIQDIFVSFVNSKTSEIKFDCREYVDKLSTLGDFV